MCCVVTVILIAVFFALANAGAPFQQINNYQQNTGNDVNNAVNMETSANANGHEHNVTRVCVGINAYIYQCKTCGKEFWHCVFTTPVS